ncbi:hypothetical protein [Glaciibacter psychrotolerans]|uniref:Uncharacterized protein n=1 Tax=Glaciibacter psychrotolerans TaxID=670054 RepID=A0A7Z0EIJ2_9MICO|nr:hypothetical protein [Leifsonia psychrotolerans]NYJ21494.1 hypothetical protein [Leifsonia psychrotolerans]
MVNNMRDARNSLHNIERDAKSAANSAGQSAHSNAATARAAQSAASGAWVGAGFQAVSAFQSARAARAAEETLALNHAMAERQYAAAEQTTRYQFAAWRQSAEGTAFMAWRVPAFRLGQFLLNRDSEWMQGWARAIGRAQAETPNDEKRRFMQHPARLKQTGLKVASLVSLTFGVFFLLGLLFQVFSATLVQSAPSRSGFTYEQCLDVLADPTNFLIDEANCEAINPNPAGPIVVQAVPMVLFLGLAVMFVVLRRFKQRAARMDPTVPNEAQARITRWGFDPLAVAPGYAGFEWYHVPSNSTLADRLMKLALFDGHGHPPAQSALVTLDVPGAWPPHENHPVEINELLVKFQQERPVVG